MGRGIKTNFTNDEETMDKIIGIQATS